MSRDGTRVGRDPLSANARERETPRSPKYSVKKTSLIYKMKRNIVPLQRNLKIRIKINT